MVPESTSNVEPTWRFGGADAPALETANSTRLNRDMGDGGNSDTPSEV